MIDTSTVKQYFLATAVNLQKYKFSIGTVYNKDKLCNAGQEAVVVGSMA